METKRNLKYFTAPPVNVLALIGWGIVVIGIILMSLFWSTRIPGLICIIVGFIVVAVTSGGKSEDSDLEYQAAERVKNLQERSEKKFEVYEKSFLKMLKPIDLKGYDFEAKEEPFYYRKGKDGKHRTNYYMGCNLIFTNEKLYIFDASLSSMISLMQRLPAPTSTTNCPKQIWKRRPTNTRKAIRPSRYRSMYSKF